ncbi:MAG: hypothetical protein ABH871_04165 [Pseudomonadota bacterium]
MGVIILYIAILLSVLIQAVPVHSEEQQSGTEMKFENVEEIRKRPSDVHIGSDPQYKPNMEQQMGGSDEAGYEKDSVEKDREYYEEKTYYKRVDDKKESAPPAKRWE